MAEDRRKHKRLAIIVGVNEYEDGKIPELEGAENDAEDIYKRLKDNGDFEISDGHFLIGTGATCKEIRRAISDVFYHADEDCDLALFYFSGHGIVDDYGEAYIAPFDMSKENPLVCGIKMGELKEIISRSHAKSTHVQCAIAILDCCYSGAATGEKSLSDPRIEFEKNIEDFSSGEGIIVLASSEADQKSREIKRKHMYEHGDAHAHGAFTFCLIEGLDGGASDDDGLVFFSRLNEYLETRLKGMGKQKNRLGADIRGMSTLMIAKSPKKYLRKTRRKLRKAVAEFKKDDPSCRISAIDLTSKVLKFSPNNKKALALKKKINKALVKYGSAGNTWLAKNKVIVKPRIPYVFAILSEFMDHFPDFDRIAKFDLRRKTLLVNLCEVASGKIRGIDDFIKWCQPFESPSSAAKEEMAKSSLEDPAGLR